MYERSAIVLERYFEKLLGFNQEYNLKQNFKNYCDLFNKFSVFQTANAEEFSVLADFQAVEETIEEIQASHEKIYKKNAKLEYNRDLIFSDISQKPEEIEKCSIKIENDISKNYANLVSLRENFVQAVKDYNEQKAKLAKCKKNRKNAEAEYNESFEIAKQNIEGIEENYLTIAREFATEENELDLISVMAENGKEEKIPFNNSVITAAAKLGFNILKKEVECYLLAYDMTKKLINELLDGAVSVELHEKTIRNIKVKLNFLSAEKEYLVQFLDYERITVIYGKRTHRTLMVEACEKFEADTEQIENLYKLLLKEIANKSTKKAYKELYNKSYLIEIEEKDAKFKKEKNRINLPVGTIMNSNYWRIEGIKNIYTVFYKDVSEVFGKDLIEFDIPKEQDSLDDENGEIIETNIEAEEINVVPEVEAKPTITEEVIEAVQIIEEASEEHKEEIETANIQAFDFEEPVVAEELQTIENIAQENEINENIEVAETIIEETATPENVEIIEATEAKKKKSKKSSKKAKVEKAVIEPEIADEASENIAVAEVLNDSVEVAEKVIEAEKVVEVDNVFDIVEEATKEDELFVEIEGIDELDDIEQISTEEVLPESNIEIISEEAQKEEVQKAVSDNLDEVAETNFDFSILEQIEFGRKITGYVKFKSKKKKRKYTRRIGLDLDIIEKTEPEVVQTTKKKEKTSKKEEKSNVVAFENKKTEKKAKKEKVKNEKSKAKKETIITETSLFETINEDDSDNYNNFEEISLSEDDIMEYTPYEEESIFGDIENKEYADLSLKKAEKSKEKKKGIFNKIIQINSKQRKEINN